MRRIAWSVALTLACLAAAGGGLQRPAGGAGSTGASPPAPASQVGAISGPGTAAGPRASPKRIRNSDIFP